MITFLSGMATMGFLVAGVFFFRFWRKTSDSLFIYFGISFCLLAAGQALVTLTQIPSDDRAWIYLLRLAAFMLLIVGIAMKNRPGPRTDSGDDSLQRIDGRHP
jgi:hypothetical protein